MDGDVFQMISQRVEKEEKTKKPAMPGFVEDSENCQTEIQPDR